MNLFEILDSLKYAVHELDRKFQPKEQREMVFLDESIKAITDKTLVQRLESQGLPGLRINNDGDLVKLDDSGLVFEYRRVELDGHRVGYWILGQIAVAEAKTLNEEIKKHMEKNK